MSDTTVLSDIEGHIESAAAHVKALAEEDLPAITAFLGKLHANPLVTAFSSVIPGELGGDAMAVLNGLLPILGALGARNIQPAVPTPFPLPSSPVPSSPASAAISGGTAGSGIQPPSVPPAVIPPPSPHEV